MSDKSKKILNDYLNTLLDMSEPPASEPPASESLVAEPLLKEPLLKESSLKEHVTADLDASKKVEPELEQNKDNLISFPEPVSIAKAVKKTTKQLLSKDDETSVQPADSSADVLKPQRKPSINTSEPKLVFKEQEIVKVDLTSHVRLNLAQKLLQDYQLRTQQKLATEKAQQTQLKIQTLVKQAVDCEISIDQQRKLLTLLKAKNLTQEMEIVEASIKVMQEQELETAQALKQSTLESTQTLTEQQLKLQPDSEPPHELKSDSSLEQSFQCLIFHVGNLKVAVPLSKLGGIHELKDDVTSLPGKPPWYIGIIDYAGDNYHVVDTAYWITPEHSSQMDLKYEYFIVMGDSKWGLGCTKIGNAVTINKSDIRWASKNSKKSWFAGMLVDEMCALLDIDNFIEELLAEQ